VTKIKIQAAQFEHFSKRSINKQINTQSRNVFPNCNGSQTVCGQTRIALTLANENMGQEKPTSNWVCPEIDYFLQLMEVLIGKIDLFNPVLGHPPGFKAPALFVWVHPRFLQNGRPARASQMEKSGLLHGGQSSERVLPLDSCACLVEYPYIYIYVYIYIHVNDYKCIFM
jgi:hypothetical protein